ncbi:hypothetical protein P170DRAFT_409935 [Aspergillus steynii IBT 23096]|uniref:Peroxisomal biogenesis factor 11 n=1 Tax=Aspergillus steynii IBT 23096 TaxID=1392250 RepID=A0A2I2G4B1_9EURO|nr:uncharacterized protein P170DRAFT_409935 [Aspergillus steynii IBT 23096]PLB47699.1 hypothetical protein P170DRAFT_409935 [Aspergillus steynii IBT 23096]
MSLIQPPSKITQFANFTRSSAGLEKTLRLIQAVAQIVADVAADRTVASQWGLAKGQLALSRRFFRFFNFIDCFDRVAGLLGGRVGGNEGALTLLIELARWSCLGGYFLLEDLTILHAMKIHPPKWTWNVTVLEEAYKLWFYALSLSLVGAVWSLLFTVSGPSTGPGKGGKKGGKKNGKVAGTSNQALRRTLLKRIVVDGCDLLIPGVFLGWLVVGDAVVGAAMVVSTLLAGRDVWGRVNS